MVIMNTNFTGHGDMVQPRTGYHSVDKGQVKCHGSALLSTGFNTGSKHVGCGSGKNNGADWSLGEEAEVFIYSSRHWSNPVENNQFCL